MDEKRPSYLFSAYASALGGQLQGTINKAVTTVAPASLSPAGGFSRSRSDGINIDDVVSCSAAYTIVTGCECKEGESISTLALAVVENLNILEFVVATRLVVRASVTVTVTAEGTRRSISFAGTAFEGLRVGGCAVEPRLTTSQPDEDAIEWGRRRKPVTSRSGRTREDRVLCSLAEDDGGCIEIAGFGRIFLAEVLISPCSVQLTALRAELCCPIGGHLHAAMFMISGGQDGGPG